MFLQARAILSAAIRMNVIGTYAAHSLLHFQLRPVLASIFERYGRAPSTGLGLDREQMVHVPTPASSARPGEAAQHYADAKAMRSYMHSGSPCANGIDEAVDDDDPTQGWAWDWKDEGIWPADEGGSGRDVRDAPRASAPAVTWPLGEILQGRHDVLHSRMFNS